MSLAFVNAGTGFGAGSASTIATAATSLTAGNLIIVGIARHATSHGLNSVTDTAGNVYVNSGANFNTAQSSLTIWYCANCLGNGSNVVTVDYGGSFTNRSLVTLQFSGAAAYPLDTWNISASTTSATPTTAAFTTSVANEVICVFGENDATGGTWSASSGYTLAGQDSSNVQGATYKIVSSIQTGVTASITSTDSTNHKIAIAITFAVPVTPTARAANSIVVTDADANGGRFGLTLNATSGATTQVRLPLGAFSQGGAGEGGAQLSNGDMLVPSKDTSAHNASIQVYDAAFNQLSLTTPFSSTNWSVFSPMASDFSSLFWVSKVDPTPNATQVRSLTPAGTMGSVKTLDDAAGPVVESMAVSQDNTTLYYTLNVDGSAIKKWDLVNNVSAGTLVASGGSTYFGQDLFVIPGTNALVTIVQPSGLAVPTFHLRRYSTVDGSILSDFPLSLGDIGNFSGARLSLDLGSPTQTIWLRTYVDGTGDTTGFVELSLVNGSVLTSFTRNMNQGAVGGGVTGDPPLCCPFFAWSNTAAGQQNFVGAATTLPVVRRRQVGIPALPGNTTQFLGRAEVQMQPGLGVPSDPSVEPRVLMAWSGDNGLTFGTEQALGLGREGQYYVRAYQHTVGRARQPVCRVTVSDNVNFTMTDLFITREGGTG